LVLDCIVRGAEEDAVPDTEEEKGGNARATCVNTRSRKETQGKERKGEMKAPRKIQREEKGGRKQSREGGNAPEGFVRHPGGLRHVGEGALHTHDPPGPLSFPTCLPPSFLHVAVVVMSEGMQSM